MSDPRARDRRDRFLLDAMLGTLVTYLRMCGYDTAYALERDAEADDRLRAIAERENRTLVTRDRSLARRTDGAVVLTSRAIDGQLAELAAAGVDLSLPSEPRRCSTCNGRLATFDEDSDTSTNPPPEHVPDDRRLYRCLECGQLYWKGSHWDAVADRIADVETTTE
ncbi:MAG: Mut7-C RNAse domain-containing protein [Halobacteriota archaeon]